MQLPLAYMYILGSGESPRCSLITKESDQIGKMIAFLQFFHVTFI